ncbi:MAG: MFS transporter, partial [Hyphomonadaceae bacterium]|nr:MFS transporter [Hyphomonadaceae bacterium]
WAPLKTRAFLVIWLAMLASNAGTWIRDVASGWLMTDLAPSPVLVSLVQAATTLPVFLLSLPAGALADILDRRALLIAVQILLLSASLGLAVAAQAGAMTPELLLALTLIGGVGAALASPAFQSIVPELVPRPLLKPAVALNSLGINIARAIGPAAGGAIIAGAGVAAAYYADAATYLLTIAAFLWWRREAVVRDVPPEGFVAAMRTGVRYASNAPELQRTLARALAFFLFASAYWALLPLIARERLHVDAAGYGALLAAIGAGAVLGALVLPRIKLSGGALVLLGTLATAAGMAGLAVVVDPWAAGACLFLNGAAWIAVLTSLNVAAQSVLPNWVRARGLAVFITIFFGAMTLGSTLWGLTAQATSLTTALFIAAGGAAFIGALAARLAKLPEGEADLAAASSWPEPPVAAPPAGERGPVMIAIIYDVAPEDRRAFLEALERFAKVRRRDGGFAWRVYEDAETPNRYVETFQMISWLDHLRQHRRLTKADAALQDAVRRFHRGAEPPAVRHLLAAKPEDVGPPAPETGHTDS